VWSSKWYLGVLGGTLGINSCTYCDGKVRLTVDNPVPHLPYCYGSHHQTPLLYIDYSSLSIESDLEEEIRAVARFKDVVSVIYCDNLSYYQPRNAWYS
jgi:hypothetical protein